MEEEREWKERGEGKGGGMGGKEGERWRPEDRWEEALSACGSDVWAAWVASSSEVQTVKYTCQRYLFFALHLSSEVPSLASLLRHLRSA